MLLKLRICVYERQWMPDVYELSHEVGKSLRRSCSGLVDWLILASFSFIGSIMCLVVICAWSLQVTIFHTRWKLYIYLPNLVVQTAICVQNLDVAIRSCGFYQSLQPFKMHVSPLHDSQKPPFLVPDRFIIKHVSISITWLITVGEGKVDHGC